MAMLAVASIPPTINTLEQLLGSDLGYGMIDAKVSKMSNFIHKLNTANDN